MFILNVILKRTALKVMAKVQAKEAVPSRQARTLISHSKSREIDVDDATEVHEPAEITVSKVQQTTKTVLTTELKEVRITTITTAKTRPIDDDVDKRHETTATITTTTAITITTITVAVI